MKFNNYSLQNEIILFLRESARGIVFFFLTLAVVMDKKDYTDEMDSLVNDREQAYEPLRRDPTPALQRRLNGKLLDLKLKRQRLSTFNYITDSDAAHHNQLNFTDYLNYTSLRYRCDP